MDDKYIVRYDTSERRRSPASKQQMHFLHWYCAYILFISGQGRGSSILFVYFSRCLLGMVPHCSQSFFRYWRYWRWIELRSKACHWPRRDLQTVSCFENYLSRSHAFDERRGILQGRSCSAAKMLVAPRPYHGGFKTGYNIAKDIDIASRSWIEGGCVYPRNTASERPYNQWVLPLG